MELGKLAPVGEIYANCLNKANIIQNNEHKLSRALVGTLFLAQSCLVVAGVETVSDRNSEQATEQCVNTTDIDCYLYEAGLAVNANRFEELQTTSTSTTIIEPTTTTVVTLPPATALPPPTTIMQTIEPISVQASELPYRKLSYNEFLNNSQNMLTNIPSLDKLNQMFPDSPMAQKVAEQKQKISELNQNMNTTVDGYNNFIIDTSRNTAFSDSESYYKQIRPRAFVIHWTGLGYQGGVDEFVARLKPLRVEFFVDKNANSYQLFESDTNFPAHGLSINEFTQGVEIETGDYDGINSPLFSFTPKQLDNVVYIAVNFLRRNNLTIDNTTLLGHYSADLIFGNPYYDPNTGNFNQNRIRKFDPPQELIQMLIINKAQVLDGELGPR